MSILVGFIIRKSRCNGSTYCQKDMEECPDLKDVRKRMCELQKKQGFLRDWIERAELHDTDNGRTWSVNGEGISLRDYHYEDTERFKHRWTAKWRRKG